MGCSASDEAADDIEVEEDYEEALDGPPRRQKVFLTIDPIDPDMGSTFKYTAWNTDTVLMLMGKLQVSTLACPHLRCSPPPAPPLPPPLRASPAANQQLVPDVVQRFSWPLM